MKKRNWIIFFLLISWTSRLFAATCGDVNSDNSIDILDALLIAQHYVGLNPSNFDSAAADVDGNGSIDIVDALLVARYYVDIIPGLPGCEPTPTPGSITYEMQAEEEQYSSGKVDTNHDGYTGTGFVNTDNAEGEWIEWNFDLLADSTADCIFRYASAGDARSMDLSINGSVVTNLDFSASGAWNTWTTQTVDTVVLSAGSIALRLTATTSGGVPNMDKMDITITGGVIVTPAPTPTPTPAPTLEPITVLVNSRTPGAEIADDALGLSYETFVVMPDANNQYYFRPDNQPLITLFKTLGIRNLRTGGNSVDASIFPVPEENDVRTFFEFAKAVGVNVIYSLRFQTVDPEYAARIARIIRECNGGTLQYFAIGNEPGYYKDYNVYSENWITLRDAILGEFPEALFCGPDTNPHPELCRNMIRDFSGGSGRLAMITQHSYPMGCSYTNPGSDVSKLNPRNAAEEREKMLSPGVWDIYKGIHDKISGGLTGSTIPLRLTETNSYWFSGLDGASNTHASALWGIDYLYWWISHGTQGLNFHTGDITGGETTMPCQYAAFVTSPNGYEVRPLGYAMKLFDLSGQGRLLPVNVSSAPDQGLVAYATLADDKNVFVTLINRAHGEGSPNTGVHIKLDAPICSSIAQIIFLTAPGGDIAAKSGLVLGGAPIQEDGSWSGQWSPVESVDCDNSVLTVSMPPASAAVVKIMIQ